MRNCQSIEEIAQTAHDHLDKMSPKDIAAFWTLAAKFIVRGNNRNQRGRQQPHHQQQQLASQLKSVFLHTMGKRRSFKPRDLATVALGFAKISKAVDNRGRGHFRGTPQQIILRDLLIGQNGQQQKKYF